MASESSFLRSKVLERSLPCVLFCALKAILGRIEKMYYSSPFFSMNSQIWYIFKTWNWLLRKTGLQKDSSNSSDMLTLAATSALISSWVSASLFLATSVRRSQSAMNDCRWSIAYNINISKNKDQCWQEYKYSLAVKLLKFIKAALSQVFFSDWRNNHLPVYAD